LFSRIIGYPAGSYLSGVPAVLRFHCSDLRFETCLEDPGVWEANQDVNENLEKNTSMREYPKGICEGRYLNDVLPPLLGAAKHG
jgi:hypothetical protein